MVGIRLLGEPAIVDRDGITVTGLRRHARQLLVYLAVHRDGADLPQIMEAFWPTATLRRAGERLSTEVGHLRSRIRQAAGDQKIQPVINTGGRYVLNAAVLDIDLWRMSNALRRAAAATDRPARIAALREAVNAHTGHLADGQDYDWIEQHREQVRLTASAPACTWPTCWPRQSPATQPPSPSPPPTSTATTKTPHAMPCEPSPA